MGKETLEAPPVSTDPYRVESIPETTVTCASCLKSFTTQANSTGPRCRACQLAITEGNPAASARAYAAAEARFADNKRSAKLWRWATLGVFSLSLGLIQMKMEDSIDEDNEAQAGGVSLYGNSYSDDYTRDLHYLAQDACRCEDLKCARDVQAKVTQVLKRGAARDEVAEQQSRESLDSIGTCVAKFE